jgi:hypothetical protein
MVEGLGQAEFEGFAAGLHGLLEGGRMVLFLTDPNHTLTPVESSSPIWYDTFKLFPVNRGQMPSW